MVDPATVLNPHPVTVAATLSKLVVAVGRQMGATRSLKVTGVASLTIPKLFAAEVVTKSGCGMICLKNTNM